MKNDKKRRTWSKKKGRENHRDQQEGRKSKNKEKEKGEKKKFPHKLFKQILERTIYPDFLHKNTYE